ncbi:MAG: metal-dependent transcriptional regulator [Bacteroidia bacterium]
MENKSFTEENYIKAIYAINEQTGKPVSTNSIADELKTKASSVTEMLKRLKNKKHINYKKYQGVTLTKQGKEIALSIIRKHRLWETFLVDKLNFKWHQVHDIAEQLEHIVSEDLIEKLDKFLGQPKFDPHGDPIPDSRYRLSKKPTSMPLSAMKLGQSAKIVGVDDTNDDFLSYLSELGIGLGSRLKCKQIFKFDNTMSVVIKNKEILLPESITSTLLVQIV